VSLTVPHGGADVSYPLRSDVAPPEPGASPGPALGQPSMAKPFEIHELAADWSPDGDRPSTTRLMWLRLREPTYGDPALEYCALAYISDLGAGFSARKLVGATRETRGVFASLNHSIWWHRRPRMNDWTLLDFCPISAAQSRGLVRGSMHSYDGTHVASIVQEALMRVAHEDHHGFVP
jgi:acyl-CoA thioesterase-2